MLAGLFGAINGKITIAKENIVKGAFFLPCLFKVGRNLFYIRFRYQFKLLSLHE